MFDEAICIGCGCSDSNACWNEQTGEACAWLRLDRAAGVGVCSSCSEHVLRWDTWKHERATSPQREIVLDTETTGLLPEQGHRIIEIGAVELLNGHPTGRFLQQYLDPERDIDPAAQQVHGISREMLSGQPRFGDIAEDLIGWIQGSRLVIHNADFDVGFLDAELTRLGPIWRRISDYCDIRCALQMARERFPAERHGLDALCDRYGIDHSKRSHHGALLDAQLLTEVYIAMNNDHT